MMTTFLIFTVNFKGRRIMLTWSVDFLINIRIHLVINTTICVGQQIWSRMYVPLLLMKTSMCEYYLQASTCAPLAISIGWAYVHFHSQGNQKKKVPLPYLIWPSHQNVLLHVSNFFIYKNSHIPPSHTHTHIASSYISLILFFFPKRKENT